MADLTIREFNTTMDKLISNVAELNTSFKYTKEALDEVRTDVKRMNEIMNREIHNAQDIASLNGRVCEIDTRVSKLENKSGLLAKNVIKKILGYIGIFILGASLAKIALVLEGVFIK